MFTVSLIIGLIFGYFIGIHSRKVGVKPIWRSLKKTLPRRLNKNTYRRSLRISKVLRLRPTLFFKLSGGKTQPESN